MRPPKPIDLPFYFLQVRTADWYLLSVFQESHTMADFHNLNNVDNITPVNEDKLRRVQFLEHLL